MNKIPLTRALVAGLALSSAARAQQHDAMRQQTPAPPQRATLVAGMGRHHHAVSTRSAEAQRFFDQGLTYVFAFNHDEAVRSFRRAAELDPTLAMAYWGVAYALGPNINLDVDPERERAAFDAVRQARKLAADATPKERDYVEALAQRYTDNAQAAPDDLRRLAVSFSGAMGALAHKYPNDLDAATLYAESMMDLRPWKLWTPEGKPAEGTEEILATLESVLKRDPNHIGAIHYYIHAVEASPHPERALPYVARLPAQVPAAGHLVHMPAHIYMRVGDYHGAATTNVAAARADENYIKAAGARGLYPLMYYSHNLHFEAIAYAMDGNLARALDAAHKLEANVAPALKEMPMLEGFMPTAPLVLVRFHRWGDVLKLPQPADSMPVTRAVYHFARAMALASTGKLDDAARERQLFDATVKTLPPDTPYGSLNTAAGVLGVAARTLEARVSEARGDLEAAAASLRLAAQAEDLLNYDEPPPWFLPARESLGGVLLRAHKAREAEQAFRDDLRRNPHNGRSLFGLRESLKAQGKPREARRINLEYLRAWQHADARLSVATL
ncbi:MAG: tetratricopeptide repeat protein [Pyrinomonadaceae bacterium]